MIAPSRQRNWVVPILLLTFFTLVWWFTRQPAPAELPDFAAIPTVPARKAAFFDFMIPLVRKQNHRIAADRTKLIHIQSRLRAGGRLDRRKLRWLQSLSRAYSVPWHSRDSAVVVAELLSRVDTVPEALVLVQAAKESYWGRSRFAIEANNLFGQWCFRPGCGIVPTHRTPGKQHEVARFVSVEAAVASYLRNLNSHPAYQEFRLIRQRARARGKVAEAWELAEGLLNYSENRQAYVDQVQTMIHQYRLFQQERELE